MGSDPALDIALILTSFLIFLIEYVSFSISLEKCDNSFCLCFPSLFRLQQKILPSSLLFYTGNYVEKRLEKGEERFFQCSLMIVICIPCIFRSSVFDSKNHLNSGKMEQMTDDISL